MSLLSPFPVHAPFHQHEKHRVKPSSIFGNFHAHQDARRTIIVESCLADPSSQGRCIQLPFHCGMRTADQEVVNVSP